ncbi:YciI family protein [Rhodoferax ferrireducens]|uniref:YciI family protein n=1 Tax=Rhodoferax ferrireducens TaxID=192843 RepID=UPI000E0D1917|nr:YciI family protein [Rhodoferax ferrireducens]
MADQLTGPQYFAVFAQDRIGMKEVRARLRPEHRAWLRNPGTHKVVVRLGGPLLDAAGAMAGTLLVVEAQSMQAVQEFMNDDPYCQSEMFEQIEIKRWQWSLGQPQSENLEKT